MVYVPKIIDTSITKAGYWRVTCSVSPGKRISVTIVEHGIDAEQAGIRALESIPSILNPREKR